MDYPHDAFMVQPGSNMSIAIAAAVLAGAIVGWWLILHLGGLWLAYAVGALAIGGTIALFRLIATGHA